jgi:hypothetical protein
MTELSVVTKTWLAWEHSTEGGPLAWEVTRASDWTDPNSEEGTQMVDCKGSVWNRLLETSSKSR